MTTGVYVRSESELLRLRKQSKKFGFQKGHPVLEEEKNPDWKGENAGYSTKHRWVKKLKGKPDHCEDCGLSDPKRKYEWSNRDHKYRRVKEDYVSRCVSCHRKYDIKNGLTIISGHNQFTDKKLLKNKRNGNQTKSKINNSGLRTITNGLSSSQ